ncbi:hypothetical protein SUGI_0352420 [Cryptomeria japonica]|nr:hypothetical protein SUGI_0352420 [Cryptomeria japonica]
MEPLKKINIIVYDDIQREYEGGFPIAASHCAIVGVLALVLSTTFGAAFVPILGSSSGLHALDPPRSTSPVVAKGVVSSGLLPILTASVGLGFDGASSVGLHSLGAKGFATIVASSPLVPSKVARSFAQIACSSSTPPEISTQGSGICKGSLSQFQFCVRARFRSWDLWVMSNSYFINGVCSPTVRIIAFQAIDPGSTPGKRTMSIFVLPSV